MKQVAQRLKNGRVEVLDVPEPHVSAGAILVDVRASLLSAGTERAKVVTAQKSLVSKARARPDDVKRVLERAKRNGVRDTLAAVQLRLDQPASLGYSTAGVVLQLGASARGFSIGDRVASGGGDHAFHAGAVAVPANLCAKIPDVVPFDHAAFATVGAIAMHGVRQADVRLGERVAVLGLGLVGQLTGQILRAAGCTVIGVDLMPSLVEVSLSSGAADAAFEREAVGDLLPSDLRDCDAVIITAATSSSDPISLAPRLCRDRGRVVIVGDVGMRLPRNAYYEKELDVRMARSYGPGRYDREYEEKGLDYPIGYVRWTEQRNMESVLDLIGRGRLNVEPLISRRVSIGAAPGAYADLVEQKVSPLGIVLQYEPTSLESIALPKAKKARAEGLGDPLSVGLIGAGSFAQRIMIPALKEAGFHLTAVSSEKGLAAQAAVGRFGFRRAVRVDELLAATDVSTVVVTTRHASHADLACRALRAGKHVFVEKPPALTMAQLAEVGQAAAEFGGHVAVGFNRRHAPLARQLREFVVETGSPFELIYRVNAGELAPDHWLSDVDESGGRLIGEGCHFVDFACWLARGLPTSVATTLGASPGRAAAAAERFTITAAFADGSLASIVYASSGAAHLPKEYIEVHAGGCSAILDDFATLELIDGRRRMVRSKKRDKGHTAQLALLAGVLQGVAVPEAPDALATMTVTFAALEAGLTGRAVAPRPEPSWGVAIETSG